MDMRRNWTENFEFWDQDRIGHRGEHSPLSNGQYWLEGTVEELAMWSALRCASRIAFGIAFQIAFWIAFGIATLLSSRVGMLRRTERKSLKFKHWEEGNSKNYWPYDSQLFLVTSHQQRPILNNGCQGDQHLALFLVLSFPVHLMRIRLRFWRESKRSSLRLSLNRVLGHPLQKDSQRMLKECSKDAAICLFRPFTEACLSVRKLRS